MKEINKFTIDEFIDCHKKWQERLNSELFDYLVLKGAIEEYKKNNPSDKFLVWYNKKSITPLTDFQVETLKSLTI